MAVVGLERREQVSPGTTRIGSLGRWSRRALRPMPWLAIVLCMALLGLYNGVVYHPHLDQPHRFACWRSSST